ncbi:EAL domain-containing protein [Qipengyuania sp.]|uniref:sensor domain-containing protein n=2 Tax=Qipengyuania sp. TaxID=2004515 RepID=UPI00355AA2B1
MPSSSKMTAARLGQIVEKGASEVYVFAPDDFRFLLVNKGARTNLGYTTEELAKLRPWDLKPEFPEPRFRQHVRPLIDREVSNLEFETVHRRKDGTEYPVSVRLQLLESQDEPVFYASIRDISEACAVRRELARTSAQLDAILNNTVMAIFMIDLQQRCLFMNKAAEELIGYTREEIGDQSFHDLLHHTRPDGTPYPAEECAINHALEQGDQAQGEEVFIRPDGSFYNVSFTASSMTDLEGAKIGTIIELRNIDEEVAAREALQESHLALRKANRLFRQAEKLAGVGSWEFDIEANLLSWSDETYAIAGLEPGEPVTLEAAIAMYDPADQPTIQTALGSLLEDRIAANIEADFIAADGQRKRVHVVGEYLSGDNEGSPKLVGIFRDITEAYQARLALERAADFDCLTDLYNRNAFDRILRRRLERFRETGRDSCVLMFDLDGFKHINDTFGHVAGDVVLKEISDRILQAIPSDSVAARWGGDEFAVIAPEGMSRDGVHALAESLTDTVQRQVDFSGNVVGVSATCGIARMDELGSANDVSELMRRADLALYYGKAREPGRVHFYKTALEIPNDNRRNAMAIVRAALADGRIEAAYQPIVNLADNSLVALEALMRLRTEERRLITASQVLPALLDPVVSREINERMAELICDDFSEITSSQKDLRYVSINVTEADLLSRDFSDRLISVLEKAEMNPRCITLEITETMLLVGDSVFIRDLLTDLRRTGLRIALDDFGTGYSSLSHLRDFPIDRVKIDSSFVAKICSDDQTRLIVQAMVVMARNLGIEVIAEGIETEEQRKMLIELGCFFGQGFLFSPALGVDEIANARFGDGDREIA